MEQSKRQITKIARDVSRFTQKTLKESGVGPSEIDVLHVIRKNNGVTQKDICEKTGFDKGAVARIIVSLEKKQFIYRKDNPTDKRSSLIYANKKADALKDSKASIEAKYYTWLLEDVNEKDKEVFLKVLNEIYLKSKEESKNEFKVVGEK